MFAVVTSLYTVRSRCCRLGRTTSCDILSLRGFIELFFNNTMDDRHVSEGCSVYNVVLVSGHFKQFVQLMTKEIDGLFRILGPQNA